MLLSSATSLVLMVGFFPFSLSIKVIDIHYRKLGCRIPFKIEPLPNKGVKHIKHEHIQRQIVQRDAEHHLMAQDLARRGSLVL